VSGMLVCVSLAGEMRDVLARMEHAKTRGADLVELRLDLIPAFDLSVLVQNRPLPVIVTHRPKREGGRYVGSEDERVLVLQKAIDLGVEYVDVECDSAHLLRRNNSTKIIVSHHDFQGTPQTLRRLYEELAGVGGDIVKLATTARKIEDNLRIFDLLRSAERPVVALAMGEAGQVSRILAGRFGAYLTYAALDDETGVASGQLSLDDMLHLYRVRQITCSTALYGVIANPVGHSMSPAIHNAAFAAEGIDAAYLPLLVDEPVSFLKAFTPLGFRGYSVTIPHKQTVMAALDEIEPLARRVGAVNTIVARGACLSGCNTDAVAALASIEDALPEGKSLEGLTVLVIGAGGLGRTLSYALAERGAHLVIANRTVERARTLAKELGASWCTLEDMKRVKADVLLQTTSVGMYPKVDESIVPPEMLTPGLVVYDAVYNPMETKLLAQAREAGCVTISGIGHFIGQAARQFELWTGRCAPTEVMLRVVKERLSR